MRSFMKIKPSQNLSCTDISKPCPTREFLTKQICLDAFRERILTKFSVFTVVSAALIWVVSKADLQICFADGISIFGWGSIILVP